jgi:hypothetical protein
VAELGTEHPHTVATRSAIGSTLAAQVLYEYKMVVSHEGNQQQQTQQKKLYVALNPQGITDQQWRAAEEHLRQALQTAIDNPRGKRANHPTQQKEKQQRKNNKKSQKKGKKQQSKLTGEGNGENSTTENFIQTLSAASAAQNLAVFLKSRATTEDPPNPEYLSEAKDLYEQVQHVRSQLLPYDHPDLYATKYSMAELLEVMGDEEAANSLRQEILDTYEPPSSDNDKDIAEQNDESPAGVARVVVVEKTVATKPS